MELAGRVAIVTGGGTGIGRSTCIRLAKAGAKAVVVNYSRSVEDASGSIQGSLQQTLIFDWLRRRRRVPQQRLARGEIRQFLRVCRIACRPGVEQRIARATLV